MATATFTEKRRQALEAFDGARTQGVAPSEYATARGLAIGDLRRDRLSASPKTFAEVPAPARRFASSYQRALDAGTPARSRGPGAASDDSAASSATQLGGGHYIQLSLHVCTPSDTALRR